MTEQIRIFMHSDDEVEFLNRFQDIEFEQVSEWLWYSGPERTGIQFMRCRVRDGAIEIGRLALSRSPEPEERRQELARQFRRIVDYLRSNYIGDVVARNRETGAQSRAQGIRVGPVAAERYRSDDIRLVAKGRQSPVDYHLGP